MLRRSIIKNSLSLLNCLKYQIPIYQRVFFPNTIHIFALSLADMTARPPCRENVE